MSDDPNPGAQKKLSTKEILAAARAAAAAKAGGGAAPAKEPDIADEPALAATHETPAAPHETPAAAAEKPAPKAAAGKPSSTADIIAAARAAAAAKKEGAGAPAASAGAKPAAPKAAPAGGAGGKPKSTADILAAARAAAAAKGAGGAEPAATPSEKPAKASPKAAAAKAAAAGEAGAKLSVEEMLAAVRPATAPEAPVESKAPAKAAAAPPVVKPMPAKPAPSKGAAAKKGAAEASQGRRWFLLGGLWSAFSIAWTAVIATTTIATLGMARFMLPNVLTEPPRKFKIGSPSDYDLGTVATKWVAAFGIWVVHTDQYKGRNLIYALLSVCTHLGCTPSWLEGEQKFKCPCHGSGFYITGVNFEGPAPRPLERVGLRIAEDGMLEVDKSVRFQEEMGQWADPNSYVEMT